MGRDNGRVTDRVEVIESELAGILAEIGQLRDILAADGVTSLGSRGQVVAHPALIQLRQHRWLLARFLDGLTGVPAARAPDEVDSIRASWLGS